MQKETNTTITLLVTLVASAFVVWRAYLKQNANVSVAVKILN
jgi:hypothetical protein